MLIKAFFIFLSFFSFINLSNKEREKTKPHIEETILTRPQKAHFHNQDETYVFQKGVATYVVGGMPEKIIELGKAIKFKKNTIHYINVIEGPLVGMVERMRPSFRVFMVDDVSKYNHLPELIHRHPKPPKSFRKET